MQEMMYTLTREVRQRQVKLRIPLTGEVRQRHTENANTLTREVRQRHQLCGIANYCLFACKKENIFKHD